MKNGPVETTSGERERIANQFEVVVTTLFDAYHVIQGVRSPKFVHKEAGQNQNTPSPFTKEDHLKITQVWNGEKIAHLGTTDSYWKLGVDFSHWRIRSPHRRFQTIIHESAHLPELEHHLADAYNVDPRAKNGDGWHSLWFWLLYAELGSRVNNRLSFLPEDLYEFPVTGGPVICNAIDGARRHARTDNAERVWTDILLNHTGYPRKLYDLFKNPSISLELSFESGFGGEYIGISDVSGYGRWTDEELYEEYSDVTQYSAVRGYTQFHLPHPPRLREVREEDGEVTEYRVVDGDESLFALAARVRQSSVPCEITKRL